MVEKISPLFSKGRVNRAAMRLEDGTQTDEDVRVLENWRAAHNYVLNTFQANLRVKARRLGIRSPVQRIKRLKTIENKLSRYPNMQMARMQDVVGCRIVFENFGNST